jgi:spore coat protein CotH
MKAFKISTPIILIVFLFFAAGTGSAQSIFDSSVLHEIRLRFTGASWYDTLAQYYTNAANGAPKQFLPVGIRIDGNDLAYQSGIRFKGEYSYTGFPGKKKPFRIHFNKIKGSQDYQGIKKINLHNLAGDPSFLREYISYGLMRSMGIAASRTAFTKLYINDVYWGCYLIVEEPEDKLFLKNGFGTSSGNLFEAASTTRLSWKGNDPAAYTELKLQTDEQDSTWVKLLQWMDHFNNNFQYNFQQQLYDLFDADQYFKILAADVFLNNWDSYAGNGRNFFIYDDPVSNRLRWIPWDYNLSMWKNDLALFPKDANSGYEHKPLVWRIKENKMLKQTYFSIFCSLLNNEFKNYAVEEKTLSAYNLIRQAVEEDTLKFYTNTDFYTNRTGMVTVNMLRNNQPTDVQLPGITALFQARLNALKNELRTNGCDCDKTEKENFTQLYATVFPNPSSGNITVYTEQHPEKPALLSVGIFNVLGQQVRSLVVLPSAGKAEISTSELQKGVYYLQLISAGKKAMKVIVRR